MSITTRTMLRSQRHDNMTTKTKTATYQASANVGDCPHQPISVAVYLLDANGEDATSEGASPDRRYRKKQAKRIDASSSTSIPTPSEADVSQHHDDQGDENINKINAHRERRGDRRIRSPKKAADLDPDPCPDDLRRSTEAWSALLDGCAAAAATRGTTSGDDVGCAVLPVHLFTSPLMRAVGTACALSDASAMIQIQNDEHDSKGGEELGGVKVAFPLPLPRGMGNRDGRMSDATNDDGTDTTANFVVLNGLCAPSAAVAKVGGASKAISEGLIDCAAAFRVERDGPIDGEVARLPLPDVDERHLAENDALLRQLRRIDRIKQRMNKPPNTAPDLSPSPMMVDGADADVEAEDDSGEKTAPFVITRKGRGPSVRFWRENDCEHLPPLSSREGNELASMFAPMTPATDDTAPSPPELQDEARTEELGDRRDGKMISVSVVRGHPERDGFMGAVNRAAYLTARAGNRTCVLVTHAEGIRELASECGYNRRLTVPSDGCAIGKFRAKVALPQSKVLAAAGAHSIKWSFYGVDDGCRDFAPVPITAATTPAPSAAATPDFPRRPRVQIALSVIGRDGGRDDKELHVLALLAPPLDPSAMGSVTLPNDLLLSESTKKRTLEDAIGTTRSHEGRGSCAASDAERNKKKTIIPLDILHGKRKLAKFIAHLRNEKRVAWGTFAKPGEGGKGPSPLPSTRKRFVVDPNDQPPIPCPPNVLFCTVYDD